METFEILVLENQDLYDRLDCQRHEVVEKFVKKYYCYFDPAYYTEPSIRFERGKYYLRYTDNSGSEKPIVLMLIGHITDTLVSDLKNEVQEMYDSSF